MSLNNHSNPPQDLKLLQNFPNPFNPTTTIKYDLPERCLVSIKIYDVIGKETTTIMNKEKFTGEYEIGFNAATFPSGVYFYQLKVHPANGGADSFVETRKMLLMK
jgi:hypothetical protein